MELSRLSNSLGSVCSQRRGRLAAVAGPPRLPRALSPPPPPLQSHWGVSRPCSRAPLQQLNPRGRFSPSDTTPITSSGARANRGALHNGPLSAGLWLAATFHSNLRSGCGAVPAEGARCFASCPARHPPERLCPTGSQRRVWSQREVC